MGLMDRLKGRPRVLERTSVPASGSVDAPHLLEPRIERDEASRFVGPMGEPYCSQTCYDRGGAAITSDLLSGWTGSCWVCHQSLSLSVTSLGSAVCGGPGQMLRFHQNGKCDAVTREHVASAKACAVCGGRLGGYRLRLMGIRTGHEATVGALLPLADGRLASGAGDGSVIVWDLSGKTAALVLSDHGAAVWTLAGLPDGRLAVSRFDGEVGVLDPDHPSEAVILGAHKGPVQHSAVLPDGRLATGSHDGTVRIWRTDTVPVNEPLILKPDARAQMRRFAGPSPEKGCVTSLVVLESGTLMWTQDSGAVWAWNPGQEKPTAFARADVGGEPLVALPDGRVAACGLVAKPVQRVIRVWNPSESVTPQQIPFPVERLIGAKLCALPDRRLLLTGSTTLGLPPKDSVLIPLDPDGHADRNILASPVALTGQVAALDDGRVATESWDHSILVWDLDERAQVLTLTGPTDFVRSLVVLTDGRLAGGSLDGTITVWEVPPRRG